MTFYVEITNISIIAFLGYINTVGGNRAGYFFSAAFVISGSLVMILIDGLMHV